MAFFGKSKEEKKNESLMYTGKFNSAFKLLLESNTINLIDDLIKNYIAIFSIYSDTISAEKYLINDLKKVFGIEVASDGDAEFQIEKFQNKFDLSETGFIKYLGHKYYLDNVVYLRSKFKIPTAVEEPNDNIPQPDISVFKQLLEENMTALTNNQSLSQNYINTINSDNYQGYARSSFTADYLMTIPVLIGNIFLNVINCETLLSSETTKVKYNDLIKIFNNVAEQDFDNKQIMTNIENINNHLYAYGEELTAYDIYIHILSMRKTNLVHMANVLIPENMSDKVNNLLEKLKLFNDNTTLRDVQLLQKSFIDSYTPESFVRTDEYKLRYFDYYICLLLWEQKVLSPVEAISYIVKGFVTENYEQIFSYKKALWDNERYINNDFSIELKTIDLLHQYENVQNGYEFEEFCYTLYNELGYFVEHTQLSNDQGADLIIEKNGERIVVQAKHYSTPVGNKAVQEVVASKAFYNNATHAIVITNNTFTPSAIKLAEANAVTLITGEDIMQYIKELNIKEDD